MVGRQPIHIELWFVLYFIFMVVINKYKYTRIEKHETIFFMFDATFMKKFGVYWCDYLFLLQLSVDMYNEEEKKNINKVATVCTVGMTSTWDECYDVMFIYFWCCCFFGCYYYHVMTVIENFIIFQSFLCVLSVRSTKNMKKM